MSTSMHNTFCIADTHMCYVSWPATKESEEWPPAMREGKPRALRLRAVCMKSTLVLRDSRLKITGEGRVGGALSIGAADRAIE